MDQHMKRRNNNRDLNNVHSNAKNGPVLQTGSQGRQLCNGCHTDNGLHHFNCLPNHLRFNQFVRTGYRKNLSTWQCVKSLFYFHNETFNIYSHGLPCILFILIAPFIYAQTPSIELYPFLYSIHYITSITCVLCSAVYHLMMCHKNGEKLYEKLIKLDMLGVWLVTAFGSTAFIYGTFFCFPWLRKVVLPVYSLIAIVSAIYIVKGTNAKERLRPLIYLGLIRFPLYGLRGYLAWRGYTTPKLSVIWVLLTMELFGLLGAQINVSRFPEKWFHGKLDYLCNSHNIMHIVVLACPVLLHFGTVTDFEWMGTAQCSA